jgi:hypothetical protein
MKRVPFKGLWVILYLRPGTDSAQPIRVVEDSWVEGFANKMLAHLLCNLDCPIQDIKMLSALLK